jgi:hypothetical protein
MTVNFSASKSKTCIGSQCSGGQQAMGGVRGVDVRLCRLCYKRVRAELGALPGIYGGLMEAMLPSRRVPFQQIRGQRSGEGIKIDEAASSGRSKILEFLSCWSALVIEESVARKPQKYDCGTLASFLLRHLDWLLAHPAAGDFADEAYELTTQVRQIADSGQQMSDIGPCVEPGCDSHLFATQSVRGGSYEVHCTAGHVWHASQWLHLYGRLKSV